MLGPLRSLFGPPPGRVCDDARQTGLAFAAQGRWHEALAAFRDALRHDRKCSDLRILCGNALRMIGDTESAELEYRQAIGIAPSDSGALIALGDLLLDLRRPEEAAHILGRAEQLEPEDLNIRRKLALATFRTLRFAEARDAYLSLHCDGLLDVHERNNLGVSLLNTGELETARQVLSEALEQAPDEGVAAAIASNLAYCHLTAGRWTEGFGLYENRLRMRGTIGEVVGDSVVWLDFVQLALRSIAAWTGGGCRGMRLLVWMEQGLGDVIMLARLLPVLLKEWQAAEVTFLCPQFRADAVLPTDGVRVLAVTPEWRPVAARYDMHCSIMSLPHLMGVTPERIPGQVPYYRVPEDKRRLWKERSANLTGITVGLAWAGDARLPMDPLRSVSLADLAPLFSVPGISFVSLQKDEAARSELSVRAPFVTDWMDECDKLIDTAALIDGLDCTISVDTAVAHLAGALGKPVWLLNRFESEWRWMRDREDTPWYPTMRIFNQTETRNWKPVIERMALELQALVSRGGTHCETPPC